jgi:hypothetical protein
MRMVVVRYKNNSVSCLPMSKPKSYYEDKYNVVCYVNKLWNPYYIQKIKKHFLKNMIKTVYK